MDGWHLILVSVVLCATLAGWVWVLFGRPTGPRVVRFARRHMAAHPGATAGDLRDALRRRFLGGVERTDWSGGSDGQKEGEWLAVLAEGVRDYWFPLDRDAIARRIEAAVAIVGATDDGRRAGPGDTADTAAR